MYRSAALVVLSLTLSSVAAYGADDTASPESVSSGVVSHAPAAAESADWSDKNIEIGAARRPVVLPALYASFVALQGYDAFSTTTAVARGAQEANALMQGLAGNKAAFWAVKAGTTAASIWLAERLWKTNRVGAVVTMVAVNGMMASVAARNASVLRTLR